MSIEMACEKCCEDHWEEEDNELKPFNAVIQICPHCRKVDVYKDDGHNCIAHINNDEAREMS